MTVLLDTHAAIWLATDDLALGKRSRALAQQALTKNQLAIASISFWEIAMLIAKGRLQTSTSPEDLRAQLLDTGITEIPLTGDIALLAVALEGLHSDPADRFIVASAIAHRANLVTADTTLLGWKHSLERHNAGK